VVFIISELCINFRDEKEAIKMIKASKDAGADAVKFQFYSPEIVDYHPRKNELICRCLTTSRVKELVAACEKYKIEFMATPMTIEAVSILSPFVKRWKIRYKDRNNPEIFKAIKLAHPQRQILVSCNGPEDTIFRNEKDVVFLSVVPEYPPTKTIVPEKFEVFKGFSSHYPDVNVPILARERGAEYIEVHTMLDKYSDGYDPIDSSVSLTMSKLKELCKKGL